MWHTLVRFFFHLDGGGGIESSCRGLSTCLYSASQTLQSPSSSSSSSSSPPLSPLSFTRSVLDFSPSPGLVSSRCPRRRHHLHHLHHLHHHHLHLHLHHFHHFGRARRHGLEEGGSVQQANQAFCLSALCKRGGWEMLERGGGALSSRWLRSSRSSSWCRERGGRWGRRRGGGGRRRGNGLQQEYNEGSETYV